MNWKFWKRHRLTEDEAWALLADPHPKKCPKCNGPIGTDGETIYCLTNCGWIGRDMNLTKSPNEPSNCPSCNGKIALDGDEVRCIEGTGRDKAPCGWQGKLSQYGTVWR